MQIEANISGRFKAAVEFDHLTIPKKPRIAMRCGTENDIATIYRHIERHIVEPVAPPSAVRTVLGINQDSVVVFLRNSEIIGFCAMLMLNATGLDRFLSGDFKPIDPDVAGLAPWGTPASGVYQWLIVAPRLAGEGMLHVAEMLRRPLYRNADVYARPVTPDGLRVTQGFGFVPFRASNVPGLYRYRRITNRQPSLAYAA